MYSYIVYYCILDVFCIVGLKVLHGLINLNQSINLSLSKSMFDSYSILQKIDSFGRRIGILNPFFTILSHGENFMAIFTTLSVVIWFSTGTLVIFATRVYVFTMRVVIYDILSMAITPTLSTSILFCNLC